MKNKMTDKERLAFLEIENRQLADIATKAAKNSPNPSHKMVVDDLLRRRKRILY